MLHYHVGLDDDIDFIALANIKFTPFIVNYNYFSD